ncbi:MAG TPA: prolyl oligopeptidase family serine peptidase, partial [Pyrinomonadaceae bacterium]|nr:prolyl oligopeptidase family serine peptidase [Pyrinomonadaceae bacterium]
KKLLVKHEVDGKRVTAAEYAWEAHGMTRRDIEASVEAPKATLKNLVVQLRQSSNNPPQIVASDGGYVGALTEPDSALKAVTIAPQKPFSWQEDGKTVRGGLTLPAGWTPGKAVPLVIQTYHYQPDLFLPDGVNTTSDAAQSLAARGMAVLQLDTVIGDVRDTTRLRTEGPQFSARIDAAVEALANEGIIDPTRVGLTGFSRIGYDTYWTITHPGRTRLAASISADSYDGSYATYLRDLGLWGAFRVRDQEALGGKGGFWQNKIKWLEDETSFNVDSVTTPALFTFNMSSNRDSASYLSQTYGAFLGNKKPIELLLFPEGDHQLIRPRERLEMMTAVVDWYCYWLKGEIPPDTERAKRWERLRKMQEAVIAEQAAKGVKLAPLPPLVPAPSWVKPLPNFDAPAPKTKNAVKTK